MPFRDKKQAPFLSRLSQPVLLGLGFAVLIAISSASIWLVNQARDDAGAVAHTLEVQNSLAEIQIYLRRAESSQRGFLLTRNPTYLQLFEDSRRDVVPELDEIVRLTSDNADQAAILAGLIPLVRDKVAELERTVELGRQGQWDAALAVVETDRGEMLMRDVTKIIEDMKAAEELLLASRSQSSRESANWLLLVNIVGVMAIISVAAVSVHLSQRTTKALRAAHAELSMVNADLEKRVAERTADLQEANQEIQTFAYIVSHDLRSPLVNIMGFTSELEALRSDLFARISGLRNRAGDTDEAQDEALAKDFEEAFGFIKVSIIKMDRLIKAILDLSRQGRAEFRPAPVDVTALVEGISATMAHQLMERQATIEVAKMPEIVSDRLALEQIFTNLVDNAVKYLRTDVPGRIEVKAIETSAYVTFLVSDNGRGIDPKDRGRVFELFRRSGPQDRPGEGIGLAHVRTLVRRMGGSVMLESELGRGTTFKITLPRTLAAQHQRDERHG
ncbi:sensor histidine kinase [Aquabacter spiritensis]|uniref:histidine kinase n=1 Tax=Aquabacter spiritensis TaxID=933073 RepID=A0A4R3M477_9HYPH|nr:CHASE3 domain-containing protein [Aquabacter spiritensis]TCT08081.1 multi-sensor signal transduction histidine kinase [Aquabacter spiritensis]